MLRNLSTKIKIDHFFCDLRKKIAIAGDIDRLCMTRCLRLINLESRVIVRAYNAKDVLWHVSIVGHFTTPFHYFTTWYGNLWDRLRSAGITLYSVVRYARTTIVSTLITMCLHDGYVI